MREGRPIGHYVSVARGNSVVGRSAEELFKVADTKDRRCNLCAWSGGIGARMAKRSGTAQNTPAI